MNNNAMLNKSITCEQKGTDYFYPAEDRELLCIMFDEINQKTGSDIHYLAEIDSLIIPRSGEIVNKYITKFSSESVKGYLIQQMVADRIMDCDDLILQLYLQFKRSKEYVAEPGQPSPAHIYVRYDNAFNVLKSRRIEKELIDVVRNPRDAFYLPLTVCMLASWKKPEMLDVLIRYLSEKDFIELDVENCGTQTYPPKEFMVRELRFSAINGLKYYPSQETKILLEPFAVDENKDIQSAAKRTLKAISKQLTRNGCLQT